MSEQSVSEEERIKAWKAERARVAAADKAARIRQKEEGRAAVQQAAEADRKDAAVTLLSSVREQTAPPALSAPATPHARKRSVDLSGRSLFLTMVVAPVLLAAFYLFAVATPLYEAQSVIAITKSSDASSGSRNGLLGGLKTPSNLPEVFRAHSYIASQALMDSLEAELGLVTEFSSSKIDPLKRLRTIPALSVSKHMQFDRFVESSIDIQSGLLTLHVRAPDRAQVVDISNAVLRNAEIQVSTLGQQLFDTRQAHTSQVRMAAEEQVIDAQAALVALQLKYQEVDPKIQVENVYSKIKELESEAQKLGNEIQKATIAGVGESAQTVKMIALEQHLQSQIDQERARLIAPEDVTKTPLNNILMEYELASLEVDLAREAVKAAIEAQATAGREAALNRSLFQVVVPPRTAQNAIYPRIPGTLALILTLCLAGFVMIRTLRASSVKS